MSDEERAREIVHSFNPMQIIYTDAGTPAQLINAIAAALAAERERCARVCDEKGELAATVPSDLTQGVAAGCRDCAAAIRALGGK